MNNNLSQNRTILLTGATGFLGGHLLKGLLEKTDYNIIVLKRSFSNTWRIQNEINNTRVKSYDIDKIDLSKVFEDSCNISVIIHTATEYGRDDNSCYKVLETNLMFPIKLIEIAIRNNVECIINTDSYFNKENMSYSFLLNYSLSKKSLLAWLKYFSHDIKVINMIIEHVYGENDNQNKFVESMIQQIAIKNAESVDITYGDQKRDFIYVDDVVDAYIQVLKYAQFNKFRFRSFDVGMGIATPIKKFIKKIKDISQSKTILNFGIIPYRDDEIMCSVGDIIDLKNIEWEPKISFEDGIRKIINYYKKER